MASILSRPQCVNISAYNLDSCLTSPARGRFTDLIYVNVTAYDNFTEAKTPTILYDYGLNSCINVEEALLWISLYQYMVNMTAANAFGSVHFVH